MIEFKKTKQTNKKNQAVFTLHCLSRLYAFNTHP